MIASEGLSTSDPAFPERLGDAKKAHRILETFGLGPALLAVALVAGDVYFVIEPGRAPLVAGELTMLALLFAGAVACVGYELRRRMRRAVLVAADRGIGVYREGRLEGVLTWPKLRAIRVEQSVSPMANFLSVKARRVLLLAVLAVVFLSRGFAETGDRTSRLVALGSGVWLALLAGSLARAAWLCATCHLPGSRAKAMLSRAELDRISCLE
jgi:hypothetical protein